MSVSDAMSHGILATDDGIGFPMAPMSSLIISLLSMMGVSGKIESVGRFGRIIKRYGKFNLDRSSHFCMSNP